MSKYYDLDHILAQEELVPCTTLFDFSYLSHLDPDNHVVDSVNANDENVPKPRRNHVLAENSRIKVPLWAVEKWAMLGYVRVSLPRHFNIKARERLEADPSEVDLRKRNERYFLSGCMLINLMQNSSKKVAKEISSRIGSRLNTRRNADIAALERVQKEAGELRHSLMKAYTGERLCRTLDWALSSVGEDVTSYTKKLTEMERRLFLSGATASSQFHQWKVGSNHQLRLQQAAQAQLLRAAEQSNSLAASQAKASHRPLEHNDQAPRKKRLRTN